LHRIGLPGETTHAVESLQWSDSAAARPGNGGDAGSIVGQSVHRIAPERSTRQSAPSQNSTSRSERQRRRTGSPSAKKAQSAAPPEERRGRDRYYR
jgi:hypothetical protein